MAKGRKRPASDMDDRSISVQESVTTTADCGTSSGTGAPPSAAAAALAGDASNNNNNNSNNNNNNEVRFGKHLASSDKKVRDRTVLALREWLQRRSKGGALTDLDLLKIWRGLWYCMFMCDKAPIQRELAQNLASLVNLFKDDRAEGVRFFRSFCVTMQRDWERIDNLRIDKYYTLVRLCLREAVSFCRLPGKAQSPSPKPPSKKKRKARASVEGPSSLEEEAGRVGVWDVGLLRAMSDVMEEEVVTLHPAPIGLRLHLADVWAEEACNAGGDDLPTEAFLVALAPWLRAAVDPETNAVVFKRTFEGVLEGLLSHFPNSKEEREEEEGGEGKIFKLVELSKVQACLFEAAAAPQTRPKRRTQLYQLHRQYQQRTGVAPDASAPPSGLIPPPPADSDDSDSDESAGEYVEAGQRPRAVRGPEPAVVGWVAMGMEAGDIRGDGADEGVPAISTEGDEEPETETKKKKKKKKKKSPDGVERPEEGKRQKGSSPKKREGGDDIDDDDDGGVADASPVAVGASRGKSKKRKSDSIADGEGGDDAASGGAAASKNVDDDGNDGGDNSEGVSSPSGRKRKKKRRERSDDESSVTGVPAAGAVSPEGGGESSTDDATPARKKAKKKKNSAGQQEEEVTVEDVTSPPSSGKKKKKKTRKSHSAVGDTPPATLSVESDPPQMAPPPSSATKFRTPPKGDRSAKNVQGSVGSARKTVRFGANMAKEHAKSMKDVKTCEITPAKDSETPRKGLLKVGGGSGKKGFAGRAATPRRSKKAADFF